MFYKHEGRGCAISGQDIYEQIVFAYDKMSPTEKKISNYLLQHKTSIQKKTITELAKDCDSSTSSLTRYARTLGFPTFLAFRTKMYADTVKNLPDKLDMETAIDLSSEIYAEDDIETKCQKLCYICMGALQQTKKNVDKKSIAEAVRLLWEARDVYCFGQGHSCATAMETWTRFTPITNKFHWIADEKILANTAALLQDNQIILFFSFDGITKDLMETVRVVDRSPGKLILVTQIPNSPGCKYADVILLGDARESPENQASFAVRAAQLMIVELLFNEYCSQDVNIIKCNKQKTIEAEMLITKCRSKG